MASSLSEIMGEEYAESFSGKLYFALEKVMQECSSNKFKALGKKLVYLAPNEMRDRIGYETVSICGQPVARWGKEEAWLGMPELPQATVSEIATTIMWLAPNSGKDLLAIWRSDPRQVAWEALNAFKLLSTIHNFGGGWH